MQRNARQKMRAQFDMQECFNSCTGKHPSALSKEALKNYHQSVAHGISGGQAYACETLWNMNIAEFFEEYAGASFEEINTWLALSGYNLYHHDVQASIFVDDGDL